MSAKPKCAPTALIGRAGLALVEFQLGRRGFENVQTPMNSKSGDIWAEIESGRVSIEVKSTARGGSWFVRPAQTRSEFFCLVRLDDAVCYILSRVEMDAVIKGKKPSYPGIWIVSHKALPQDSFEGWSRFGSIRMRDVYAARRRPTYKSTRRITHILADGTEKTYIYPGNKDATHPQHPDPLGAL